MDLKLKNEVRAFELKQFRNIGYGDNSEENSTLILNYSLNPEYMGDLVILIGPNNSGKSNVLDALSCLANRNISKHDFSDTKMEQNYQNPSLKLFTSDKPNVSIYEYILGKDNLLEYIKDSKIIKQPTFNLDQYITMFKSIKKSEFQSQIGEIIGLLNKNGIDINKLRIKNKSGRHSKYTVSLDEDPNIELLDEPYIKEDLISLQVMLTNLFQNRNKYSHYPEFINDILNKSNVPMYNFLNNYQKYLVESENQSWLPQKLPKITKYKETNITDKDLKCKVNEIEKNSFFKDLIKILKVDKTLILNVYKNYRKNHNDCILHQETKDFNKNFRNDVENLFNQLYCIGDDKYHFEFNFQPEYIAFNIFKYDYESKREIALTLNHQSTGFKWFFDFFFNVYAGNEFKVGDIIIMDEPATNLHVKGQEELRLFLKKFAINSGITFAIATHSPFIIDLDYLDEVRLLIPQSDNTTWINNSFTTVKPNDPDSLRPIRKSLTVRNSVLLDPKQIVIFVEGATDYNYLVAMKKLIGNYNYLTFLPINGVGKKEDENQQRQILEKLRQLKSLNSLILIDSDPNANNFDRLNKDNKETNEQIESIQLKDINKKFSQIENVFSERDQLKFGLKNNDSPKILNKSIAGSITFKKIIQKEIWKHEDDKNYKIDVVDNETIENFKHIFEFLTNKVKEINLNNNSIKNAK